MNAVAAAKGQYTIGCVECKKPLWAIHIKGQYGSKFEATKTPFPGVPAYEDFWSKDQQPLNLRCPHCNEYYFKAVKLPNGTLACVPTVLELEGV